MNAMAPITIGIIILVLILALTITPTITPTIYYPKKESYINAPLRAQYIVEWFNRNGSNAPDYLAYRDHITELVNSNKLRDDADIVEYQTAKVLFNGGKLSVENFLAKN